MEESSEAGAAQEASDNPYLKEKKMAEESNSSSGYGGYKKGHAGVNDDW